MQLAPEIQKALLFLPRTVNGCDPIREHPVGPITAERDWHKERRLWRHIASQRDLPPQ